MSRFQTNILFGSLLIAGLRYYFCVGLLDIDAYVGVIGGVASISVALWLGWKQPVWGFIGGIMSTVTAIGFIFSAIPIYQYTPNLDTFYATQIPKVLCSDTTQGSITINSMNIDMRDICTRGGFPILAEQEIKSALSGSILIDIGMGKSAIIGKGFIGRVERGVENNIPYYSLRIIQEGTPKTITTIQTSTQLSIQNEFNTNRKKYLETNYPRKRSYAPGMTRVALGKMRVLALLDWRYNDWIKGLEFYMSHMK